MIVGFALAFPVLLTGCSPNGSGAAKAGIDVEVAADGPGELMRRVENWQCPSPAGGEHTRPLYNLDLEDEARIKEARERIELMRRQRNNSWEAAESDFRFIQMHFALAFYNTPEYKERALLGLRQAAGGMPAFTGTAQEFINEKKRQYDTDCKARNEGIKAMLDDEPKLAALRGEARHPWLLERNRIACFLAAVPNCKV